MFQVGTLKLETKLLRTIGDPGAVLCNVLEVQGEPLQGDLAVCIGVPLAHLGNW